MLIGEARALTDVDWASSGWETLTIAGKKYWIWSDTCILMICGIESRYCAAGSTSLLALAGGQKRAIESQNCGHRSLLFLLHIQRDIQLDKVAP